MLVTRWKPRQSFLGRLGVLGTPVRAFGQDVGRIPGVAEDTTDVSSSTSSVTRGPAVISLSRVVQFT